MLHCNQDLPVPDRNSKKPMLMVIDDDPVFRAFIGALASSRYQIIEYAAPQYVDPVFLLTTELIVLDLNMPHVGGIEFMRTLAAVTPRPQLLIASGMAQDTIEKAGEAAESYGLRITALLQKPIEKSQFDRVITSMGSNSADHSISLYPRASMTCKSSEIFNGMEAGEFLLHYQPQIDIKSGRIVGIEGLARWDHSKQGILFPADFIETLELSAHVTDFTILMLEISMRDYMLIRDQTGFEGTLSINVPPMVFGDEIFVSQTVCLAEKHKFPLEKLVCETTERVLDNSNPLVLEALSRLKTHDVKLSICNLEIGRLNHRVFSVSNTVVPDEIKIGRSFISKLNTSKNSENLIDDILYQAAKAGANVVAVGIEDAMTLEHLQQSGCPVGQGYYFSRPVPAKQLIHWINSQDSEK